MKKIFFLLSLAVIGISCEPAMDDQFEIFVIKEGEHYTSRRHVESLQQSALEFDAKFDESARYTFNDQGFQDSKNKLLGFSDCNDQHHENSARFAWMWYNDRIEIFAYCYNDGIRVEEFVGATEPNEINHYRIEIRERDYVFSFKGKEVIMPRRATCDVGTYLMLWPYFGGQIPAPHDISIYLKRF